MQQDEQAAKGLKTEVIHARLSADLKGRIETYGKAHGMSMSSAVADLLGRALEDASASDGLAESLALIAERIEGIAKDCGLASKRAGKASQASLGVLALMSSFTPDLLRFLANEALMRGQMLARVLDNKQAAENVKVPASLGRLANARRDIPHGLFGIGREAQPGPEDVLPCRLGVRDRALRIGRARLDGARRG